MAHLSKIWFPIFDYLVFNLTNNNRYRSVDNIFTRVNIYVDINQVKDKKLREIYKGTDLRSIVLHEAEKLEGSIRNTGIHAAGIIIAPKDLTEIMPVATSKDSTLWITQIEGSVIEEAGVIKMDFLGLKTLSILKTALQLIKQNHGITIDLDTIPLDDEKTFHLYQRG